MNILLNYFFPISLIEPTPAASTAFLKQVLLVVKPKMGVTTGVITPCTTMPQVTALTDNTEAQQIFNAGKNKVLILPNDDLDLAAILVGHEVDFFTLLVSSDFSKTDIANVNAHGTITISSYANLISGTPDVVTIDGTAFTAQAGAVVAGAGTFRASTDNATTAASLAAQINAHATASAKVVATVVGAVVTITALVPGALQNALTLAYTDNDTNVGATKSGTTLTAGAGLTVGAYVGVVGVSETDDSFLLAQAALPNRCAFHTTTENKAKNMCFAFGQLLANEVNWTNQQYITMPFADDVNDTGDSESYFDDRISFVLNDTQYGPRLGFFVAGGKAIAAPYIIRNFMLDLQSAGLSYISGNQPDYTKTQAALVESELQKVCDTYVDTLKWLTAAVATVVLVQDNFVGNAGFNIAPPKALWRLFGEMRQTL